jgi:hypothetical protein
MMKTQAGYEIQPYEVSGKELRIHWNIQEVTKEDMEGETYTVWEANEALCLKTDNRSALIQKIIGSVYSVADEIATINNAESKPEEYAEYQTFRAQAKALADGWLNKES